MADSVLLNDGSSFLVLNDGTSTVLLNEQTDAGININRTHATQITKRRTRIINVVFTFWLISRLKNIEIKLLQFGDKLHPKGIYTDALRESFVILHTDIKQKLEAINKKLSEERLGFFLEEIFDQSLDQFKIYMELLKRFGRK